MSGGIFGGHNYRLREILLVLVVRPGMLSPAKMGHSQMLPVPRQRAHLRGSSVFSFWGTECGRALLAKRQEGSGLSPDHASRQETAPWGPGGGEGGHLEPFTQRAYG